MLCLVIQGPGIPCGSLGAYPPGALFSVVVWTSTRLPYRSDNSWGASRCANNSYWPVGPVRSGRGRRVREFFITFILDSPATLGHRVPSRKSKESDKDSLHSNNGQVWLWIGLIQTKRRASLMFVGLQRSEVMAKTGSFLSPPGTQTQQTKTVKTGAHQTGM